MKPVIWFASVIAVFCLATYFFQNAVVGVVASLVWFYWLGRWVGGPHVWKRGATTRRKDNEYAVNSLDTDASPAARGFAWMRERDE